MSVVITLPALPAPVDELWHSLLDLEYEDYIEADHPDSGVGSD